MLYLAVPWARSISRVGGGFPPGELLQAAPVPAGDPGELPALFPLGANLTEKLGLRSRARGRVPAVRPRRERSGSSAPSDPRRLPGTAPLMALAPAGKAPAQDRPVFRSTLVKVCW